VKEREVHATPRAVQRAGGSSVAAAAAMFPAALRVAASLGLQIQICGQKA
jgi:hypothetical protein